ncbi:MAG: hypothetical protein ACK52S_11010 [Pirellula sp.]
MKSVQRLMVWLGVLAFNSTVLMDPWQTVADDPFEQPPIRYSASVSMDPVAMLKMRMDR